MTDYVIWKNCRGILYDEDDEVFDIEEVLVNYPYIVKSMNEENYALQKDTCIAFYEILSEDKVVGFITVDLLDGIVFLLTDCYILPEFRGNSLFYTELSKLLKIPRGFGILQPTRKMVELLIEYSIAKEVDNNIVVSGIDFYFYDFEAGLNKNDGAVLNSNFYDLGICSTILINDEDVIYHNQLQDDIKNYGERKNLSKTYFENIKKQFEENKNEYNQIISFLKDYLPIKKMTYDEFIGHRKGLSDFLMRLVEKDVLYVPVAFKIQNQITDEYLSGVIDDDTWR